MVRELICRREFCRRVAMGATTTIVNPVGLWGGAGTSKLRYIVASSMYGQLKLAEILPEVRKTGAEYIDIWPKKHGNQREQIEEMGHEKFAAMLKQHKVKLGISTRYDLGPFRLQKEMRIVRKLGGTMIVSGAKGPKNLKGSELKEAVRQFAEKMKPHIAAAEETGIVIGIENHSMGMMESEDSMLWFAEFAESKNIGIALAPYHLPQEPWFIAKVIRSRHLDLLAHYPAQTKLSTPMSHKHISPRTTKQPSLPRRVVNLQHPHTIAVR